MRGFGIYRRLKSVFRSGHASAESSDGAASSWDVTALPDELSLSLAHALAAADLERFRNAGPSQGQVSGSRFDLSGCSPSLDSMAAPDAENRHFWDELCGSQLAKVLGIVDSGPESLARFDSWYFDFYPYLDQYLRPDAVTGKRVLEVGLGYGSVAQRLAESGADYVGLDIANGPVEMVRHRLSQMALPGRAIVGSVLAPPFPERSFDTVVAIGSLHHTGNLGGAIERCRNLLRPGGSLIFMVYYAYSYRQCVQNPAIVLEYAVSEASGFRDVMKSERVGAGGRRAYDKDEAGNAAPHTDFVSRASLRAICDRFSRFDCRLENIDQERPFLGHSRAELLSGGLASSVGLDLYAIATA